MEIKAAKDAAAAASEEDPQASKKKKARKKPIIQFQQGATAQESVERMLQSKNLDDRLNRQQLTELFACALPAFKLHDLPSSCCSQECGMPAVWCCAYCQLHCLGCSLTT